MRRASVFPLEGFSGKVVGLAVWAEPPESALRMHLALCPNRRQQWAFAEALAEEQKDTGPCPLEACSLVGGTPSTGRCTGRGSRSGTAKDDGPERLSCFALE